MTQPLSGIRVLDLGRMVAAPWCTQLLGDLGAEIIKIERPGAGDDIRNYGPPFLTYANGTKSDSPYHLAVNRNKKSVTADLSTPEGQKLVRELAAISDVLVENYKVGDLARRGLDYESIREINPGLVYCSITGFGQTGPYAERPGLDSVFQATSGLMSITGEADGPPQKVGIVVSDLSAGMYATVGILAALRAREVNGGKGQHLDIALLDCQMAMLSNRVQGYLLSGDTPTRTGSKTPGNEPSGQFECQDGPIILSAGADRQFRNFAKILGRLDWCSDDRFATRPARVQNRGPLQAEIEDVLKTRPRAHWLALFGESGVMSAPINTIAEALEDPQVQHRGLVVDVPHPEAGSIPLLANPIRFSETPIAPFKVPPALGHDTQAVLGDLLGYSRDDIETLRASGVI